MRIRQQQDIADSDVRDAALLANLGYKQEFTRDFTPFEVFGLGFSIIGVVPSVTCVSSAPQRPSSFE